MSMSLLQIWNHSDLDRDGSLDLDEYILFMYLCEQRRKTGNPVPDVIDPTVCYIYLHTHSYIHIYTYLIHNLYFDLILPAMTHSFHKAWLCYLFFVLFRFIIFIHTVACPSF